MTKMFIAAVFAVSASAGSASAQGLFSFDAAEGGAFVSGFAGSASPGDAELGGGNTRLDAEFDSSATYGAAIGYRLPFKYWTYFQPRLELEISSREADVSSGRLSGAPRTFNGDQTATYLLLNNYNDITWRDGQRLVPFLGGGLGVAKIDLSLQEAATFGGSPGATVSDDTTAFATTFAGGLSWHATERFELYGEARLTSVYGASFDRTVSGIPGVQSLEDDFNAASFTVGARLNF